MSEPFFRVTIPGRPIVKKNTQRIVGFGKSKRAIYSKAFKAWERIAILECRRIWKYQEPVYEPIEAVYRFYFENKKSEADVSNLVEGPQDALKAAGVIHDDRIIQKVMAIKYFGEKPRVEIELTAVKAEG